MVSARQAGIQRRDLRRQRLHDRRGLRARGEISLHRHGGQPVATPDDGIFLAVLDGGNLAQRNRPPVRQRDLERPDSRQGRALLGRGSDQDVDQPNSAAHLCGGDAGQDCVHSLGQILGAHAQETGLVLVDLDPDRARRPDPVVVHIRGAGGGAEKTRHPGGDCAHLLRFAPAYPVLEWPSDRRAKLERIDAPDDTREAGGQLFFQPRLHALALLESLGDDRQPGRKSRSVAARSGAGRTGRRPDPHRCSNDRRPDRP